MSRTYYPKNKKIESFDTNSAGTIILSIVVKVFDLPQAKSKTFVDPPWNVTNEAAIEIGEKLKEITDEQIKTLFHNTINDEHLFAGTENDFVEHIRNWQNFLLICKGYTT